MSGVTGPLPDVSIASMELASAARNWSVGIGDSHALRNWNFSENSFSNVLNIGGGRRTKTLGSCLAASSPFAMFLECLEMKLSKCK